MNKNFPKRSILKAAASGAFIGALLAATAWSAPARAADQSGSIYSLLPNTALSGVINPNMPDRTDIPKAWPKKPADAKTIRIGWTDITLNNPWFVDLIDTAKRVAPEQGFAVDVQIADGSLERQCSQIDTFITNKVDVIVVDPTQILGVAACINRAVDKGIPVVAIGTVPSDSAHILTTITPNPYQDGFMVGDYVAKSIAGEPIVAAALIGVVGNSTSESRINGMISGIVYQRMQEKGEKPTLEQAQLAGFKVFQTLKNSGKINDANLDFNLVGMGEGNWTEQGGLSAAENILAAHGNKLNLFLTDNDFMGVGALRAIRNIGKIGKVQVASAGDGDRHALKLVEERKLLAVGTWSPEQTATATIDFLNDIFRKGMDANNLPLGSYFPPAAITKENVADFTDPDPKNKFYKYTITPVQSIPQIKAEAAKQASTQ